MALDFPSSPTNGQTFVSGNRTWTYNTTTSSWEASSVATSKTANYVYAAPNGSAGIPDFRALVAADLPNTAVTAGSYTNSSITVDAQGRITAASNGTAPVTSVTGTAPIVSSGGTTPAISISAATTSAAGSMSAADKTKLDGIATSANNYVLPKATASALGGVEVFDATVQTVAANTVTTTASRTYGVQLNAADQMVVNVPWTNSGGTVTSVGGTGTVSGLTLTGTVTASGNLTLGGTLSLTSANVTGGLGFSPSKRGSFPASPEGSVFSADIRNIANPTTGLGYAGGGRFRFSSLNDDSSTPYADVIDLSTYTDSSGGGFNSLYFGKNSQVIQHKYAAAAATTWTVKTLAYTDSNITGTAANITGVYGGTITSSQITTGLGFTPYNSTNPSGYITSSSLSSYLPLTGGTLTGVLTVPANATTSGGGINFAGAGSTFIRGTSGDGASSTTSNLQLQSWFGIGFGPTISGQTVPIGENAAWLDCRSGSFSARADFRAPIFYDSNDTTYYVNPNNTSTSAYFAGNVTLPNTINAGIRNAASDAWLWVDDAYGNFFIKNASGGFYADFTSYNFRSTASVEWATMGASYFQHNTQLRSPIYYDSNDTTYYVDANSNSILNTSFVNRYFQRSSGVPTNNLGDPTVTEMALFEEQFDNKTAFFPPANVICETSTDGTTWTALSISDANKKALVGGTASSGLAIPYNTPYFRVRFVNRGDYVFLNALYSYWSSNGHQTKVQIYKKDFGSTTWVQHTSSNELVSSWPGHLYLPFSGIAYHPGTYVDQVAIVFQPTWNASFSSNGISLYKMQIWGGYPAGKRSIFSIDSDKNVTFPSDVRATLLYDTNDTTYYVDPNSTSVMNAIQPWGEVGMRRNDSGTLLRSYNTSASSSVQFYVNHNLAAVEIGNARGIVYAGGTYWQVAGSTRSPIFYDSDNTAFFADFASTGADAVYTNGGYSISSGDGKGFRFWNDDSYKIYMSSTANATWGGRTSGETTSDYNMYFRMSGGTNRGFVFRNGTTNVAGIDATGRVYSSDGRIYLNNATNNFIIAQAGASSAIYMEARGGGFRVRNAATGDSWFTALDGVCTAVADFRAPIFYDSNDTNRYVDPNSTSQIGSTYVNGYFQIQYNSGSQFAGMGIRNNYGSASAQSTSFIDFMNENGIQKTSVFGRIATDGAGYLEFLSTAGGVSRSTDTRTTTAYAYSNQWSFQTSAGISTNIVYDRDNTAFYFDGASTTNINTLSGNGKTVLETFDGYLRINQGSTFSNGTWFGGTLVTSGGFYAGSNGGTGTSRIAITGGTYNGSNVIFLDGSNGVGTAIDSWRAPIFYDYNDTGYFINPNSESNLNITRTYIGARDANANWNTGFQNTPAYTKAYHGDLNGGTNAPAGGWWFYESMRHSNASNYWGAQIAWGWEDNANRLLQRNVTNGSFGGWVEYLNTSDRTYSGNLYMTGSIRSTSSDMRAPIFYDQENTAYYANPSSTSIMSSIALGGATSVPQGVLWANGEIWLSGNNNRVAFSTDTSGDNVPNASIRGSGTGAGDLIVQNWSGSATNDNFWVFGASRDAACAGNITAYYSDERLKTKTGNLDNALEKVMSLEGFTYIENEVARSVGYNNSKQQVGLSAQKVKTVLPEAVALAPFDYDPQEDGTISSKSGEEYLTVDYSRLVPLLIEAIKEQQSHITKLEEKLNKLLGE